MLQTNMHLQRFLNLVYMVIHFAQTFLYFTRKHFFRQPSRNFYSGYSTILLGKIVHCRNCYFSDNKVCYRWPSRVICTQAAMINIIAQTEHCKHYTYIQSYTQSLFNWKYQYLRENLKYCILDCLEESIERCQVLCQFSSTQHIVLSVLYQITPNRNNHLLQKYHLSITWITPLNNSHTYMWCALLYMIETFIIQNYHSFIIQIFIILKMHAKIFIIHFK